jgi:hypothetical protein
MGRVAGYGHGHYIATWKSAKGAGTAMVAKILSLPPEPVPGRLPLWVGAVGGLASAAGLAVRRARRNLRRTTTQPGAAPPAS